MDPGEARIDTESLTPLHWVAIALATVTGVVHLVLGLVTITDPLGVASVLAAAGYAGALTLIVSNYRRRLVIALGIPYVATQIVLWYLINEPTAIGDISPIAAFDKIVQTVLIVVLAVLLYRESTL